MSDDVHQGCAKIPSYILRTRYPGLAMIPPSGMTDAANLPAGDREDEHRVALVVFPGFQIQDLSGPLAAFESASHISRGKRYQCHVVSQSGGRIPSSVGVEVVTEPLDAFSFDTVIVTGGDVSNEPADRPGLAASLRRLGENEKVRLASVCTGAFILAESGLLDGRSATTHWRYALLLQRRFPAVKVRSNEIFISDRGVWTSAGVAAGIDLSLALIADDLGANVAKDTACQLVYWHQRPGGQAQYASSFDVEPTSERMRDVVAYIAEHLSEDLATKHLADVAGLSARQFGRAFLAETGLTPAKAVELRRVEMATPMIQAGNDSIEHIAEKVGFVDPERMRRAFIRVTGHPPQSIRRMALVGNG